MKDNESLVGKIRVECINKHTVQIEMDNTSIDFLIEVLVELKNTPGLHHLNFDSDTGYMCGFMTHDSLDLILNNRDKYIE